MSLLQVRDFPDELYEQLKVLAKAERRSVSQQTVIIMDEYLKDGRGESRAENNRRKRRQVVEKIRRWHCEHPEMSARLREIDPAADIREQRDRDRLDRVAGI
jgi:plasmid stability protein